MYRNFMYRIKSSIGTKFMITFLLLLIIPLIIATWLFGRRLHTVLRNKELAFITEKINYAEAQFDRVFSEMDHIATSLILDYHVTDILADPAAIPSYDWFSGYKTINSLLTLLSSNADYRYNITISSHDDRLYHSGALYNSLLRSDDFILDCVREGNGNPVLMNRTLESSLDSPVICLGRSVYQKGAYLGSILVDIPASHLDALLGPLENDTTWMYVLDRNASVLYSSRQTDSSAIDPALYTALEENRTSVTIDGTEYLLSCLPARQNGLLVVTLVASDSVFRESSQAFFLFILAFSCIILGAIVGIFWLTYIFTRDIRALNAAVTDFGNDPQKEICLPVRSADEAGQLTEGFISMSRRIRRLLQQVQQDERNKRILEFDALQAQINPHMIYNTLNTITYLSHVQNIRNIEEVSSSFAHLLRSISNQGQFITIAQEMEYLRSFIAIKKYNLLTDIETDFQVDENVPGCRILKLLLQPIVENAILHGFAGQMTDCLLSVTVSGQNDRITIDISDNGKGMDEELIQRVLNGKDKSSNTFLRVGVKNIADRLSLQYGDKASLSIVSAPGCGTTVHIFFPAERSNS